MLADPKQLWDSALAAIEVNTSRANFGTWFRQTRIIKQDNGIIYLGVPSPFAKDWLYNKFHKSILHALRNLQPEVRALEYLIVKAEELVDKTKAVVPAAAAAGVNPFSEQPDLPNLYINREDNLNPRYLFETFVVGPFNELAHAAAQAVSKKPGANYNPLFIYGATGLGKTHLIQAVGNQIKRGAGKKVYYVTSEQFGLDYVNALQTNKAINFKEKYRKYDLLVMDDVQFFGGKDKMQDELFHLFNSFYENNKQIIFSADKPPKLIAGLEDRLRTRFEGGMMVDVIKPDYESRLAIMRTKLKNTPFYPADEVLDFLASVIQDSIRELEGMLNTIVCQSQLKSRNLSLAEVKQLIKNNLKPKKTVSIKNVANIVADFYHINERELYEKTRKKEVVKPRQVIMYILREDFSTSYPYIGQKLGGRDHTTVIHAYEKIKNDLSTDTVLSQEVEQIRRLLLAE